MKKKSIYLCSLFAAALMFVGCSDNEVAGGGETGESGSMKFSLTFSDESAPDGTRAASSVGTPTTGWSKIKHLQLFLYDKTTKTIQWSAFETVTGWTGTTRDLSYTNIKAGTYKLVVVANANSTNAVTYSMGLPPAAAAVWDGDNVRQKDADDFYITHKTGAAPSFMNATNTYDALTNSSILDANTFYTEPAEIFMGTASVGSTQNADIVISSSTPVSAKISLIREVSLMRVRVNNKFLLDDPTKYDVNFKTNSSIIIYRLPDYMKILAANDGGVSSTSTDTNLLSIYEAAGTFKETDPATGYTSGTTIVDAATGFNYWRDVIVFPNNGGRANNGVADDAMAPNKYVVMISAQGAVGHELANGTKLTEARPVYWVGLINTNFVPNIVREVNLTITNGGTIIPPVITPEYGDLNISVSTPTPWNSTIRSEDIDV